jgi:regulator of replication initiation timing
MGPSDIAKAFNEIITEHGSSAILKERVAFLRDQMEALVDKVKELEAKNADLEKENGKLTAQLKTKASQEEFVEHRGALFKRKPEGGYHLAVYSPICHNPTGALDLCLPYSCERASCMWMSNFTGDDLKNIFKELP